MNYTPLPNPLRITYHDWPEGTVPLVSIHCMTYNHEIFIRDAIEGFLMQETTFPVEILIHDDASTDGTAEIVREYEKKYPRLIKPIYQIDNQFSQGKRPGLANRARALGEFIALCEGDDYWIAPLKLQKQVGLLEQDLSLSMVFHNTWVLHEDCRHDYFLNHHLAGERFTLEDIVSRDWFIATGSILLRRNNPTIPECLSFTMCGDWVTQLLAALNGDVFYLNEVCSVYRRHPAGISMPSIKYYYWEKQLPNHIWTFWVFDEQVSGGLGRARLHAWLKVMLGRIIEHKFRGNFSEPPPERGQIRDYLIEELTQAKPPTILETLDKNPIFSNLMDSAISEIQAVCLRDYYYHNVISLGRSAHLASCGRMIFQAVLRKALSPSRALIMLIKATGWSCVKYCGSLLPSSLKSK